MINGSVAGDNTTLEVQLVDLYGNNITKALNISWRIIATSFQYPYYYVEGISTYLNAGTVCKGELLTLNCRSIRNFV